MGLLRRFRQTRRRWAATSVAALLLPWCLTLCVTNVHSAPLEAQLPVGAEVKRGAEGHSAVPVPAQQPSPPAPCHSVQASELEHTLEPSSLSDIDSDCPDCDDSANQSSGPQLPVVALGHSFAAHEGFASLAYRASTPVGPDPPRRGIPIYLLNEVFLI